MRHFLFSLLTLVSLSFGYAQAQDLTVTTVTRAPFSMEIDNKQVGFSMDLWAEIAANLGLSYSVERVDSFGDMLGAVETGQSDLAIANISITSAREQVLDFSHPIFASGLQIMIPASDQSSSIWRTILTPELGFAILGAFLVLFAGGMLMWFFERRAQEYFDKPGGQAMFPAFWWALNLVVNGGFEERCTPHGVGPPVRYVPGGVFLVFCIDICGQNHHDDDRRCVTKFDQFNQGFAWKTRWYDIWVNGCKLYDRAICSFCWPR